MKKNTVIHGRAPKGYMFMVINSNKVVICLELFVSSNGEKPCLHI